MLFRTARRSRAALAALAPLTLAVATLGPQAVSPALAATATYTITTGTTGSYAYADDTPAYPLIDSDGSYYFQSSHSLYAASASRSWQFYTGTDMDTNTAKAAASSAPDNANTTVRCNNSPTGLESTYAPDASPTSTYGEKNYCDLVGVWVDPDSGTWYGAVHDEFTPSPFHDGLHYDSIDYAQSTDHGNTWTIVNHIITSPFSTVRENDQNWVMDSNGTVHVGTRCLNVSGGGTTAGTAVNESTCNGTAGQVWTVTNNTLVNPNSSLCATASGTTNGSSFTLQNCAATPGQVFNPPSAGSTGQIKLAAASTSCIDSSTTLQLAACNDPTQDGRNQFPNQTYYYGDGDPKLFVDYASGYFYLYYDTQILNQAGGGRVDFGHVARAPISGKMAPSSWSKWYNGSWSQPGLGGKEADLVAADATNPTGYLDDAYNPANTGTTAQQLAAGQLPSAAPLAWLDVAYDAYLGEYITMARPENPTSSSPLHIYATADLSTQKWTDIGTTTSPAGSAWYRSLLDGTSKTANYLVGKTFRNYCMYSCGTALTSSGYVNTTIDSSSLPTPPVTAGTPYQVAAGNNQYLAQSGSSLTTQAGSNATASQSWKFTATGDGFFTIANASSGQNLGVNDTANSGRAWGAPLTLGSGTSVGYQWFIQSVNDANLPGGSYRLVNRYSGQALSLTSGTGGATTAPQRDWANTGTTGDTHAVNAQTLTFPAGANSTNLIPGGNFESGNLTGWTVHNAAIVTDSAAHSPTNDLQLKSPAGDYATMEYTVTGLQPNTTYTFSGWVRADSGASTSLGVKNFGGTTVTTHITATGWTPASDTFTTGATNTTATIYCYLPNASATSTYDDLSLTLG